MARQRQPQTSSPEPERQDDTGKGDLQPTADDRRLADIDEVSEEFREDEEQRFAETGDFERDD
jgi:hypothetical protein